MVRAGLVLNFLENDILKIFAPQNVESEKSMKSFESVVFFSPLFVSFEFGLNISNLRSIDARLV